MPEQRRLKNCAKTPAKRTQWNQEEKRKKERKGRKVKKRKKKKKETKDLNFNVKMGDEEEEEEYLKFAVNAGNYFQI